MLHVALQPAAIRRSLVALDKAPSATRAAARPSAVVYAVVGGLGVDVPYVDCAVLLPGIDGAELEELLG